MSVFLRRSCISPNQCRRLFSTFVPRAISLQLDRNDPDAVADTVPAYPYGPARWYKQSDLGLYGGQRIQFGNNVGPKFQVKTRRKWHVNVKQKRLWSKALNRFVQVRVSARTLRTIDKVGGLDEYLLGEKEARIKGLGMSGWWLRWAIMQTGSVKRRLGLEREALGIPALEKEVQELEAEAEVLSLEASSAVETAAEELEDDAEAVAAAEEDEADLEVESVATDDAFTVEHDPSLPPLQFRVGPAQHLVLTPQGWKRTRPNNLHLKEKYREHLSDYVQKQMRIFNEALKERMAEKPMHNNRKTKLMGLAARDFQKEREAEIERMFQRKVESIQDRQRLARANLRKRNTARKAVAVAKEKAAAEQEIAN